MASGDITVSKKGPTHFRFRTPSGVEIMMPADTLFDSVVWEGETEGTLVVDQPDGNSITILGTMRSIASHFDHFDERKKVPSSGSSVPRKRPRVVPHLQVVSQSPKDG